MTVIEANVRDFSVLPEGAALTVLVSGWRMTEHVPDLVVRPDADGNLVLDLLPTSGDEFYSVQLSWTDGVPRSEFLKILVPEVGPVRLLDLVVPSD